MYESNEDASLSFAFERPPDPKSNFINCRSSAWL